MNGSIFIARKIDESWDRLRAKKWFGILCILLGVGFIAYPSITGKAVNQAQDELESDWETLNETYENYSFPSENGEEIEKDVRSLIDENEVVGRLVIPKIDLDVIVAPGVSQEVLQYAVGWMPSTALPHEQNNTVLAAHRSNTYGKFFNRVGELEIGDEIIVETLTGEYVYEVDEIKTVEPTDLSVLEQNEKSMVTLITCGPFSDKYRVIVHAKEV